jgi:hypothetical protein
MMKNISIAISIIVLCTISCAGSEQANVYELRCEHLFNPLGIDVETPRFSWKISNPNHLRGQYQTAYRIFLYNSRDAAYKSLCEGVLSNPSNSHRELSDSIQRLISKSDEG